MNELRLNRFEVIQIRNSTWLQSMTLDELVGALDNELELQEYGKSPRDVRKHLYEIGYMAKALLYQRDQEQYASAFTPGTMSYYATPDAKWRLIEMVGFDAQVTAVFHRAIAVLVFGREILIGYDDHPEFRNATVEDIFKVKRDGRFLFWPTLNKYIDLTELGLTEFEETENA
jgi:hypothetical protein